MLLLLLLLFLLLLLLSVQILLIKKVDWMSVWNFVVYMGFSRLNLNVLLVDFKVLVITKLNFGFRTIFNYNLSIFCLSLGDKLIIIYLSLHLRLIIEKLDVFSKRNKWIFGLWKNKTVLISKHFGYVMVISLIKWLKLERALIITFFLICLQLLLLDLLLLLLL